VIKPKIFENIAVYYLEDECSRSTLSSMQRYFENSISTIKTYKINTIMLSFLNVVNYDKSAMAHLFSSLNEIAQELEIFVSIMEYKKEHYKELNEISKQYNISTFKSFEIAKVFFEILTPPNDTKVVVFDENLSTAKKMANYLQERGCRTIAVDSNRDFKTIASREAKRFLISNTYIDFVDSLVSMKIINDIVVYTSGNTIDKKMQILFNNFSLKKLLNKGHKIVVIDAKALENITVDGTDFLNDINFEIKQHSAKLIMANADMSKLPKEIVTKLHKLDIEFIKDLDSLVKVKSKPQTKHKKPDVSKLKKSLVTNIPFIVDSIYDTFSAISTNTIEKVSHKISVLDIENSKDLIATVISISGDIHGSVVIVSSVKLIKLMTIQVLRNESLNLTTVSQAMEIVSTNLKEILKSHNISTRFNRPVSYNNVDAFLDILGNMGGIMVTLNLENEPLHIFVTSPIDYSSSN
jgi:hypothetical protein